MVTKDSELEVIEVAKLARELGDDIAVVNVLERLAFPAVRIRRRPDGSIVYGLGTQVYLEGARVVSAPNYEPRASSPRPEDRRKRTEAIERALVEDWRMTFGFHQVRAAELLPFAGDLVNEVSSDRGQVSALGQRLSRMCGRTFDGYTVIESGRKKNSARYQLQRLPTGKDERP